MAGGFADNCDAGIDDGLSVLLAETPSSDLERPAYTFVWWLSCATDGPLWSNLAYVIAGLGLIATILRIREPSLDTYVLGTFGVLALPVGLPAVYEAYHRRPAS